MVEILCGGTGEFVGNAMIVALGGDYSPWSIVNGFPEVEKEQP